jgi:hypothetical protein
MVTLHCGFPGGSREISLSPGNLWKVIGLRGFAKIAIGKARAGRAA